ncbi:efflux RND transporter periplasmic adaptor subunit [Piscinibacter sakaiensis]|uniref:Uncharacterized protein n=1 Tax=Piscinibacter sakaiensis TaxID=1547922 RepID=A0A0K8NVF1_PISS1|nr:efflux RND transporter periplasmic adaptor subunit [Piscinibacter sakaiensis]GAP34358.1 hypothetical protein ISF6_4533 [Piscinibacter sakaiensis]
MSRAAPARPGFHDVRRRRPRPAPALRSVAAALLLCGAPAAWSDGAPARPPALSTAEVVALAGPPGVQVEGQVEAVRQTVVAAQVPGAVVALAVRAGDRVQAGQWLVRLDARAAEQQAGAAGAQAAAARAAQEAAAAEFQRQRQLADSHFISPAALDRAAAQFKAATAQADAQAAAARAARTQTGYAVVQAPYDGIVADVAVVLGDMAMPGRPLLTVYDPSRLRVSAPLPESAAAALRGPAAAGAPRILLAERREPLAPARWELLPAIDAATHTLTARFELPPGSVAAPGGFARVLLPGAGSGPAGLPARLSVPARAVTVRGGWQAVYVVGADGRPLLRPVRLGPADGDRVEVLTGLAAGERVALDPQAAARIR